MHVHCSNSCDFCSGAKRELRDLYGFDGVLRLIASFLWASDVGQLRSCNQLFKSLRIPNQTARFRNSVNLMMVESRPTSKQTDIETVILGSGRTVYIFREICTEYFPNVKHLVLQGNHVTEPCSNGQPIYFPELQTLRFVGLTLFVGGPAPGFLFTAPRLQSIVFESSWVKKDAAYRLKGAAVWFPDRCTVEIINPTVSRETIRQLVSTDVDVTTNPIRFALNQLL